MALIKYEAINKDGEKVSGIFSGTEKELISDLQYKGLYIKSLKESRKKLKKGAFKLQDLYAGLEEIYYLTESGMEIDNSINILIRNSGKESVMQFWSGILDSLKKGEAFSKSLEHSANKNNFNCPPTVSNVLSIGEELGDISLGLKPVLDNLQFRLAFAKEIKSSLSYPIFLVIISLLTMFFVSGFILPKFASIFSPEEIRSLPLISQFTLRFGSVVNENFQSVIVVLLVLVSVASFYFKKVIGFFSDISLGIPFIKDILLKKEFANIFSSMGAMLSGGVDITKVLAVTEKMTSMKLLKNILKDTLNEVKKGNFISSTWSSYDIIPDDVISMVTVGEKSANLGNIFEKLSERYSKNFKDNVSRFLVFLEPLVIVFVGLFVAFIVVSIMLAVVSINDIYG